MIPRLIEPELLEVLQESRVAFLSGPRQSGKSTLVKALASGSWPADYVTLDDPAAAAAAEADPEGFLSTVRGPIAVDEVQRVPQLLLSIKRIVDDDPTPGRFLLTGSADLLALPRVADTLAGRMEVLHLWPLAQSEFTGGSGSFVDSLFAGDAGRLQPPAISRAEFIDRLVVGGYPEVAARTNARGRARWFDSYLQTIIRRELLAIARLQAANELPRLLSALAARPAALLNVATIAGQLSVSHDTAGRYLSLLETIFLVQRLPSWLPSAPTRSIKAPKVYIVDTGLASHLLGVDARRLALDPNLLGGLSENFVGMELIKQLTWSRVDARQFHWRTAGGVEVDHILETRSGDVVGIEVKASSTIGADDFGHLARLRELIGSRFIAGVVVYLGSRTLPFGDRLHAVPVGALWT
jgi:predicted AAA+ superfamily ATPase